MIERGSGRMQLVCACGESQRETWAPEDFAIMLDAAKRQGWRIVREDGEWEHYCPSCKGTAKQQRRLF